MSRSQPHSAPRPIPTLLLIFLLAALCLVLVAALLPADVAWATPPQQGTVPPARPPSPPGIPEPATITLVGLGIGALAGYAWRRRKTDEKPPEE
jgi:uncharacterized RDD family membrane protein YckC